MGKKKLFKFERVLEDYYQGLALAETAEEAKKKWLEYFEENPNFFRMLFSDYWTPTEVKEFEDSDTVDTAVDSKYWFDEEDAKEYNSKGGDK